MERKRREEKEERRPPGLKRELSLFFSSPLNLAHLFFPSVNNEFSPFFKKNYTGKTEREREREKQRLTRSSPSFTLAPTRAPSAAKGSAVPPRSSSGRSTTPSRLPLVAWRRRLFP